MTWLENEMVAGAVPCMFEAIIVTSTISLSESELSSQIPNNLGETTACPGVF
ncbi:hypothetical protein [Pseudoalteromonas sp. MTN2-4]|uniref:hypothetical protein n=1 Tax=Pseudoalteromonas sp. MTN2-4 TaxID=3056555 RepID=UPI0036F32B69